MPGKTRLRHWHRLLYLELHVIDTTVLKELDLFAIAIVADDSSIPMNPNFMTIPAYFTHRQNWTLYFHVNKVNTNVVPISLCFNLDTAKVL